MPKYIKDLTYGDTAKLLTKFYDPNNDIIAMAIKACKEMAKEETVALVCGVNSKGFMEINIVPSAKSETLYGRILNHCVDIYHRLQIRQANCVRGWSERTVGNSDPECKRCYERADMIVHGFLCGLAIGAFITALVITLVR